jgi:hypothetical protein
METFATQAEATAALKVSLLVWSLRGAAVLVAVTNPHWVWIWFPLAGIAEIIRPSKRSG